MARGIGGSGAVLESASSRQSTPEGRWERQTRRWCCRALSKGLEGHDRRGTGALVQALGRHLAATDERRGRAPRRPSASRALQALTPSTVHYRVLQSTYAETRETEEAVRAALQEIGWISRRCAASGQPQGDDAADRWPQLQGDLLLLLRLGAALRRWRRGPPLRPSTGGSVHALTPSSRHELAQRSTDCGTLCAKA